MTTETQTPEIKTQKPKRRWRLSRRGFLIGAGVTGVGLALGWTFGLPALHLRMAESLDSGDGVPGADWPADPWAWFEVLEDSRIRFYTAKVEMGQGVHTALAQIAAEELGIGWADLDVAQATTHVGPADSFGTSGSMSVATVYTPLREAAATLREMLRTAAATTLSQPVDNVVIDGRGFAVAGDATKRVDFYALVANKREWDVPETAPPLKNFTDFQVIGQPLPRVDIPAKVTGQAIYGYDMRVEGMKYGAIARPPTIEGKLTAAQPGKAKELAGVHTVVTEADFAGVVADSRAQARAALTQLQLTWDEGKRWQQAEIDQAVAVGDSGGVTIQSEGDAPSLLQQQTTLRAEYRSPFAVQTPLEAQAAVADVRSDSARVWVSTQMQGRTRDVVAEAIGLEAEKVEIIPTYLGGGFGRKAGFEVAVEAARLSKAAGVPVHVGWDRTEELRYGYFRPPTHHVLAANLDENGQIVALEHQQASGDVAFGFLPGFLALVMGADFGATRGARLIYDVPNRQTVAHRVQLPVRTGWWRGLGLLANTFAIESFMDELAHSAAIDPLTFRLNHLGDDQRSQRLRAVLEAVAEKAGWGQAAPEGRARGLACCIDADTTVAQVAEVSFDAATNRIKVHQITAAMDCGLTINPDGAAAQIEGNIIWGVGSTFLEELQVKDGQIALNNFDTYPLLTMRDAPHVEVTLLEAGDGKPRGVGEPPIGPVAAAIGNAFFALTGTRLRQIPFTPERVRAALAA
ncbi:MAG: xanthine dehydrogenase family protein molybdopterin-binding subunit [Caldilinea sp. CFX5]|nr:xanthine dehydrogenase family protein molybdopterin-binding subunit [Caldilinea sp. CFX5]